MEAHKEQEGRDDDKQDGRRDGADSRAEANAAAGQVHRSRPARDLELEKSVKVCSKCRKRGVLQLISGSGEGQLTLCPGPSDPDTEKTVNLLEQKDLSAANAVRGTAWGA